MAGLTACLFVWLACWLDCVYTCRNELTESRRGTIATDVEESEMRSVLAISLTGLLACIDWLTD